MDRQLLFQMFAQRMNLHPEEAAALQNGDFEQAFKSRAQDDPLLMSMVSMMRKNREEEAAEPEPRRQSRMPDEEIEDMREAMRAARTVLRYLAQVMGACNCWGKNRRCPRCVGKGSPGFRGSTEPETFLAWVRPGLEALGYQIKAPNRFDPIHSEQSLEEK